MSDKVLGYASFLTIIAVVGLVSMAFVYSKPETGGASDNYQSTQIETLSLPEPSNYFVDDAEVVSSEAEAELIRKLASQDIKGTGQVAALITKSLQGLSVEEYSIRLAEKWKAGDAEADNGVILLIATEDRKVRIEVGAGVEDKITDSDAAAIIAAITPTLKTGDWAKATDEAITKITEQLN